MIDILKEYIKSYLVLNEDKARSRSKKYGDAKVAIDKINEYYVAQNNALKKKRRKNPRFFDVINSASQGNKDTDAQINVLNDPMIDPNIVWNFEVKSFSTNDKFSIEITNPSSDLRKIVLSPGVSVGSKADKAKQIQDKISSDTAAKDWAERQLQLPGPSVYTGKVMLSGKGPPRGLSMSKGEIGDWTRIRALGGRGNKRDFYTVSNYDLKNIEKDMYYTDELEEAIGDQFLNKGDDVLIIMGKDRSLRCFSLSEDAKNLLGFPSFYANGANLVPESTRLTSFGEGGRFAVIVQLDPESGLVIP